MTTFKKTEVVRAMERKGFRRDPNRTNHNIYYLFDENGRITRIHTMLSHNKKDIDDSMMGMMTKEFGICKRDLIEYFNCHLTEAEYLKLLRDSGRI